MGIGINDFRIAIRIDNAEAKQKLVETKDVISVLRNELSKMETDGKKDTAVYIEKKAALDKLNNCLLYTSRFPVFMVRFPGYWMLIPFRK